MGALPVSTAMVPPDRLLISLFQISVRIAGVASPLMPPLVISPARVCTRSDSVPSGSPRMTRLFGCSTWMTPGSVTALAEYTTPPIVRPGPRARRRTSSGSIRGNDLPACGPGRWSKYHHGMPFITNATEVSRPSNGAMAAATAGSAGALTVTNTASCGPSSAGSDEALTGA